MPKSNADRVREYRARKRAAENKLKKRPKTSTERVRLFRAKQKKLQFISAVEDTGSVGFYVPYIQHTEYNSIFKMGKTNAEHCKNYYNRKKAAKEAEKIRQGLSVGKPIKKTGAERTRAYRLRKIMLSQANESSVSDISSIPSTSNSRIRTFEPSFQLVTTSASTNRPDVSTVSSTGIADHDGDNLHDSFLST